MTQGAIALTIVFEGMNLNRDEGVGGNIQTLKKLHRGDGLVHTFMSRQALRYAISKKLIEEFGWKETPVTRRGEQQKTNQFDMSKANIIEYEEMDFFGYMYTIKGENAFVRSAVCKLTPAISLEKYSFDQSFNANHEMVKRAVKYGEEGVPNPWQTEDHYSLYKYSFVIDLDRIGKIDDKEKKIVLEEEEAKAFLEGYKKYLKVGDKEKLENLQQGNYDLNTQGNQKIGKIILRKVERKKEEAEEETESGRKGGGKKKQKSNSYEIELEIDLPIDEKVKRIRDFLIAIKTLSRGIQGNINSLSPLFVIGGIISAKTPLAHPLVELVPNTARKLNKDLIDYAVQLLESSKIQIEQSENQDESKEQNQTQQKSQTISIVIKGIAKAKFENGDEFSNWKSPSEALDELIRFIESDEFKRRFLDNNESSKS